MGITGANFLVAETGTSIIVTNEGNGDLTQILPKVTSCSRRSTSWCRRSRMWRRCCGSWRARRPARRCRASTPPSDRSERRGDPDGPQVSRHPARQWAQRHARHAVPADAALHPLRRMPQSLPGLPSGRRSRLWLGLPGPMGAVLTPSLVGLDKAGHLPNASTFCGRCEEVCPMKIPLPGMMRHWREAGIRAPPAAGSYPLWSLSCGLSWPSGRRFIGW